MNIDQNKSAQSTQDSLVGSVFASSYEILSLLGKGGTSTVYKALYLPMDQLVAVKILQTHLSSGAATAQRLQEEARLSHSLQHPNILRVYRFQISEEGNPYLVSELIEGRSLQDVLVEEGAIDQKRFMTIFEQAMAALEFAHSRSVVHRDIKPSNLMIAGSHAGGQETVKVVDFGIAKLLGESSQSQTATGSIIGSPQYMSPEQCRGEKVDARTDIYSLACVMYETLTGVPAFSGETTFDTMYQKLHSAPPAFASACPQKQLSPQLEQAIFAGLKRDADDRPQTIAEFRSLLRGESTPVVGVGKRFKLLRRRRPILIGIGVGAALAAVVALALGITTDNNSGTAPSAINTPAAVQAADQAYCRNVLSSLPSTAANCEGKASEVQLRPRMNQQLQQTTALALLLHGEKLLRSEPPNPITAVKLLDRLGITYDALGKHEEARQVLLRARAQSEQKGVSLQLQSLTYFDLSHNASYRQDQRAALRYALEAARLIDIEIARSGVANPNARMVENQHATPNWQIIGSLYEENSDWAAAEAAYRRLFAHAVIGKQGDMALRGAHKVALTLHLQGKNQEALQWLDKQILPHQDSFFCRQIDKNDEMAHVYEVLGHICQKLKKPPETCHAHFAKAVELARLAYPDDPVSHNVELGHRLYYQAIDFYADNKLAEGDRAMQESLDCGNRVHDTYFVDSHKQPGLNARALAVTRLDSLKKGAMP